MSDREDALRLASRLIAEYKEHYDFPSQGESHMHDCIVDEFERFYQLCCDKSAGERQAVEQGSYSVSSEVMLTLWNTLMFYSNRCSYEAERIGGILAGCPRGKTPMVDDLIVWAEIALNAMRTQINPHLDIPCTWQTSIAAPPAPSSEPAPVDSKSRLKRIAAMKGETRPTEGATPAQEFHCSVSIHGPCQVYLAKDYNELRERVKELEKAAEPALRYIQHVGSNQTENGLPHPQQWIVDLLIAAIAKKETKP